MTRNLGGIERAIRIVLGVILLASGSFAELPVWGTAAALIVGAVLLVTGAIRFCPCWSLFGINTGATKPAAKS